MLLGIVLAGGRSSRMGRDKALLNWHGKSLLQRAVQNLQAAGCDHVVISRNAPGFICDIYPQQGPVAGLHACLSQVQCDEVLVQPIDMPLLSVACLAELVTEGRAHQQAHCYSQSVLPCYFSDPQAALTACELRLKQQRRSIHGLLKQLNARQLTLPTPRADRELINTNTPQQWAWVNKIALQQESAWGV